MQFVPREKLMPPSVAGEFELVEIELPMSSIGRMVTGERVDETPPFGICVSQ